MKRSLVLTLLAALIVSACGGAGTGSGGPKVGMVTDTGGLDDKSFNEFSWKGVQDGAKAVGGTSQVIVTKDAADYKGSVARSARRRWRSSTTPRDGSLPKVSAEFLEIERMTAELEAGPEVHRPSLFWTRLNARHRTQLQIFGFANFKRTLNTRYFNWGIHGILRQQLGVVASWVRRFDPAVFRAEFPDPSSSAGTSGGFDPPSAWIYKTFVAMFADLVRAQDALRLLERIDEPALGNPFTIRYRGRDVSQDLCNSIHEIYSIFGRDGGALRSGERLEMLEIGAGYGRLAYAVLAASPGANYTIVDVPPALYVSQRYLTTVLPDVPAFRYREWSDFATVRQEFAASRLRFLLPHQAGQLPVGSIDVAASISSLHEMSRQQVEYYFGLMDRVCRGRVYTKQWRSRTPENGVVFGEHEYPVPARWREQFHRRHAIQRLFFEARYEVARDETNRGILR